jgi:microcystin-dependent protein
MANYEATRYDFDGANLTNIEGINTGIIVPWTDTSVPAGFLECDGSAVSRSTYADLFAVIGTTYGAGNGSTTFDLPDLQDNVLLGKSNNKALASTGGANTVSATGNVGGNAANHTLTTSELAAHTHALHNPGGSTITSGSVTFNLANPGAVTPTTPTGGGGAHSHTLSGNFAGDATSVLQPYLTVIYIIKT